jgi:CHAT domain-containing protein/tetratricopeptide (TPR) repeat protein
MTGIGRSIALILLLLPSPVFAAEDPLPAIGTLLRNGQAKEARAAAVRLRDSHAAQPNPSGEAAAWLLMAIADSMLEKPAAVREDLQQATARFTSLGDSFGAWVTLLMLAELEKLEGRLDESEAAHARIEALVRDAADPKTRLRFDAFKVLAALGGMEIDAFGPIFEHPAVLKPFLLSFMEVMSRDKHASLLIEMGELEKADEQLNLAASAQIIPGMFDSSIEAHRGTLRLLQWRLDEARASYLKALQSSTQMPVFIASRVSPELGIMRKLASLEVLTGRTDEALAWNDRVLEHPDTKKNANLKAELLHDRAALLQKGGRIEAALAAYGVALDAAAANKDTYRTAVIHSDLGTLHMSQGTYGSSLEHLEKAIELFQSLDEPYVEAPLWVLLAEVHMLLESHDGAQFALDRARTLAKKSGFKLAESMVDVLIRAKELFTGNGTASEMDQAILTWFSIPETRALMLGPDAEKVLRAMLSLSGSKGAEQTEAVSSGTPPVIASMSLLLKGKMLLDRGDVAQARETWQQALAVNPNGDNRAGLLALIGVTYWREGKSAEAIRYLRETTDAIDAVAVDVKVEELLAGYLGSARRVYFDLLIDMLVSDGQPEEAFAHAERARARAFLQLIGNHRLNATRGADPRLVQEAEALRTHIGERERAAMNAHGEDAKRIAADLERERQHYRTVMTRVKVSSPEYAALTTVEPLAIEAVQRELPRDATLISYFVSTNGVHAWTISSTAAHHTALPIDRAQLQRIVCWAARFGPAGGARGVLRPGVNCAEPATAEEAFDALFAPLVPHIDTEKLILIPHGALHYVPFAALRNRESGCHLIENYTLTYAPSASVLRFLQAKETPLTGGALVLGDPASPIPSLAKLPGAKEEATTIARRLGATARTGEEARETLLYGAAGKTDLVHLAAHGLYDAANPLFSRIALAPGESHDGSLTVHEILSSLDLSGVNLVVLSACQSAAGARSGGDEVVGLTRALLYAGTPGVISTLWNIDDAASAGLMDAFYRRLGSGESAAVALRQAQIETMRSEGHGHPKYWAAFMLTGDPQARWTFSE